MPQKAELESILRESGAWLEGHFLLTSGKHGDQFLLMDRAFEQPMLGERLGKAVADLYRDEEVQTVVGPAVGAVILGYEVAAALGCRSIFAEKTPEGGMELKRGFELARGERVLVVENAVSTGGSVRKVLDHLRTWDVEVVGVGAVADRSGGRAAFGVPFRAAITFDWNHYDPAECPLCARGVPLAEPKGHRG